MSYQTEIARWDSVSGLALVTDRKYSVTTSQHVGMIVRALPRLRYVMVPELFPRTAEDHFRNAKSIAAQILESSRAARKARTVGARDVYEVERDRLAAVFQVYCSAHCPEMIGAAEGGAA